jgi:predicted lipoprotein with Yx(FWY)xxD motif
MTLRSVVRKTVWMAAFLVALFGLLAYAAGAIATVQVMESPDHGPYLTDGDGRALYMFVDDPTAAEPGAETMSEGVRDNAVSCVDACLEAWPAFFEGTDIRAGEEVNEELLYVTQFDDRTQVVYNGWPLFYFVRDEQPGDTNGHGVESFGGYWLLVAPDGSAVALPTE